MCFSRFDGARLVFALLVACAASAPAAAQTPPAAGKISITSTSEEARALYLKGRDLAEKLRATDARRYYEQAAAKDAGFALAYVGLANTSGTNREFVDAVTKAVGLASKVSDGERHMVLALEAGLKNDPAAVLRHYTELVALFPKDERAQTLLANTYFGRQEYQNAIDHFVKATEINANFSQPYNQMGYAYRFLGKYGEAEAAFKKYVELIPGDPNPYDSYAELLMKMGRFDESMAMYNKALAIDANFVASYIGIGNDQLFKGQPAASRETFAKIAKVARNTGEKRTAHFWTAASYVHEGATDKALAEIEANYALSGTEQDGGTQSGDLNLMGDILREAGRIDEALVKYGKAVEVSEAARVPAEAKAATRRNHLFEQARAAVAKHDLGTAKTKAAAYGAEVAARKVLFELRQQQEIEGLIALEEKRYAAAAQAFAKANQQDPCILYLTAVALKGAGDTARAAEMAGKAAAFNQLSFNYGYVRAKALKMQGTAH
jgi:tetratricopeptide (TPR) repeat protein